MKNGQIISVDNEEVTLNICRSMRQSSEIQSVSAISYKAKINLYHDLKIEKRDFMVRDFVLLYNYKFHFFVRKLKSKWTSAYLITQLFSHGAFE